MLHSQILVTHHISLCLPGSHYLVRLSSGNIEMQGLVSELTSTELAAEYRLEKLEAAKEARDAAKAAKKKTDDVEKAATKVIEGTDSAAQSQNPTRAPTPEPADSSRRKGDGKLVQEEARAEGRVKWSVYRLYLSAAGYETWVLIVLLLLAGRGFRVVDRVWFKYWGESVSETMLHRVTRY